MKQQNNCKLQSNIKYDKNKISNVGQKMIFFNFYFFKKIKPQKT